MGDIQIIYEGTDIYPDISVSACIHDMYAGERADELLLRLNDTRELWDIWSPKPGDTIVVRYGAATTGKMYVGSIIPENGLVTLRALSIPQAAKDRTNKTWESIRFLQLCEEIAARHGLTFVHYGITDRVYGYAVQHDLPDFAFLWQRCVLESAAFLVYDGTLVVYSEQYLESQPALGTIVLGPGDDFEYSDDSGSARGRAEVTNGSVTGTYTAPNGSDRTLRKTIPLHMGSRAEADRFAKGLLRNANKDLTTGAIWQPLSPSCAAGSVVSVRTGGTRSWDGPVFLTHVRHDYVNEQSKLFFRKPMEGY